MFLWNKHLQLSPLSKELINLAYELQPCIPWKTLILLQNSNCSHTFLWNTVFFQNGSSSKEYHSFKLNYQLWYLLGCRHIFIGRLLCYLMTSFTAIHFFYGTVIIPRNILRHPFCQGHCVYFKTQIAAIRYMKLTGFTSATFEGYSVYLRKAITALRF